MIRALRPLIVASICFGLVGCGSGGFHSQPTAVPRPSTLPSSAARPDGYTPALPPKFGISIGPYIGFSELKFIEGFEGFVSCPYRDTVGTGTPYTRGYGETEGITRFSPCISRSRAAANLKYRLERFYGWALRSLGRKYNQHQITALYSFAWNLGAGIFTGSLRSSLQRYNASPLLAYDHAQGRVLIGLRERRRAEVHLFNTPMPRPKPLTRAQRRGIEARVRTLRRVLLSYGCDRRRDHRLTLGSRCKRWFAEGARLHHVLKVDHY